LGRIQNIQALRAFAAASVLVGHAGFWPAHVGAFGVDIFFVISGFIMAGLCELESAGTFARRRLTRILPLYWGATLAVFALALIAPSLVHATRPNLAELLKSLLFIPFTKSNGNLQPVLYLGWTLNCEMFFYSLLVAGLACSRKYAAALAAAALCAVVAAGSLIGGSSVFVRFYGRPLLLEFVGGMLCFAIARRMPALPRWLLGVAAAAAVVGFFVAIPPAVPAIALVLAAVLLAKQGFDTRSRLLVLAGDASYVLYLIHPYLLGVCTHALPGLAGRLAGVAVSLALPLWIHLRIEKPAVAFFNRLRFDFLARDRFRSQPVELA